MPCSKLPLQQDARIRHFCNRCSFELAFGGDARSGTNFHDFGCPGELEFLFLVEEDRIHIS